MNSQNQMKYVKTIQALLSHREMNARARTGLNPFFSPMNIMSLGKSLSPTIVWNAYNYRGNYPGQTGSKIFWRCGSLIITTTCEHILLIEKDGREIHSTVCVTVTGIGYNDRGNPAVFCLTLRNHDYRVECGLRVDGLASEPSLAIIRVRKVAVKGTEGLSRQAVKIASSKSS